LSERPLNAIRKVHNGRVYLLTMKLRGRRKGKRFVLAIILSDLAIIACTRGIVWQEGIQKQLQTNNLLRNLCSSIHRMQINLWKQFSRISSHLTPGPSRFLLRRHFPSPAINLQTDRNVHPRELAVYRVNYRCIMSW